MKVAIFGMGVAAAAGVQEDFIAYAKQFNKAYSTEEVFKRYEIFSANKAEIDAHNAKGTESWTMAVNQFTDMTADEFSSVYKGYKPRENDYLRAKNAFVPPANLKVADSLDWNAKGAVTPVKDQGQCGSCWSFSTTGGMEGAWFLAKGELVSLSEQQLVDCAGSAGNQGCNGGLMDDAFNWIIKNKGLAAESAYPYHATDGKCNTKAVSVATISSYADVAPAQSEAALLAALNTAPVSIAVDAQNGWQTYGGGVYSGVCGHSLDHGVLLVGYGTDSGKDYWLVKNSWSTSWGEKGYIRILRGSDKCGVADAASVPTSP